MTAAFNLRRMYLIGSPHATSPLTDTYNIGAYLFCPCNLTGRDAVARHIVQASCGYCGFEGPAKAQFRASCVHSGSPPVTTARTSSCSTERTADDHLVCSAETAYMSSIGTVVGYVHAEVPGWMAQHLRASGCIRGMLKQYGIKDSAVHRLWRRMPWLEAVENFVTDMRRLVVKATPPHPLGSADLLVAGALEAVLEGGAARQWCEALIGADMLDAARDDKTALLFNVLTAGRGGVAARAAKAVAQLQAEREKERRFAEAVSGVSR